MVVFSFAKATTVRLLRNVCSDSLCLIHLVKLLKTKEMQSQ